MAAGNIQNILKMIGGRPQDVIENKLGETIELEPVAMNRLVYIGNCTKCEMILKKKAAKVLIENCQNVILTMNVGLVSETMEVIGSGNITINITEGVAVSTITADNTTDLQIFLHTNETQLKNLYSHHSSKLCIKIIKDGEQKEFEVIKPANDPEYLQFLSHWKSDDAGGLKLVTEKVLREGIYPYTEEQK